MENPPSKLSYTVWGRTVTIEREHSDIGLDDFKEDLYALARASGWSEEQVKEIFNEHDD